MKLFQIIAAILTLAVLAVGCGADHIFRSDLSAPIYNLDPQFSQEPAAKTVLRGLFEGLVIQSPEGEILPGCAERWDISPDRLTYTFYLRPSLTWDDKDATPLTPADFIYAFERLLCTNNPSPYAEKFSSIRGAAGRLAGEASPLGVAAAGADKLVIVLERPDPMLLTKLSDPAAAPCNREFFLACKGRYGLDAEFVQANGPYSLTAWNNDKYIMLRANEAYHAADEVKNLGANLYIGRESPEAQLEDGKSDVAEVSASYAESALRRGLAVEQKEKAVWCIAFNLRDPVWKSSLLRQGLGHGINREQLFASLPKPFQARGLLLTQGLLAGESPLTELSISASGGMDEARRLFRLGMESADLTEMPQLTILIPDDDTHFRAMQPLQQDWQKGLSIYPRLQRVSMDTLQKRLSAGDYQAALVPVSPPSAQAADMLALLRSGAKTNFTGYSNPLYDGFLDQAQAAASLEQAASRLAQAHRLLLSDAPVIPLYVETAGYALSKGTVGLWIYPPGDMLYFARVEK